MTEVLKSLNELRHKLHQNAELAFKEEKTSHIIKDFMKQYQPDEVLSNIASTGMAFIFKGKKELPSILFRADLDALPICEKNQFSYHSHDHNVSHKCGHDGHMTMVAAIATELHKLKDRGDVILFFQPAEETGEGAFKSLQDKTFQQLKVDYVFGLHNIPNEPLGTVLYRRGTFACGSVGLKVKISGHSSHACEPHLAKSPFDKFTSLRRELEKKNSYVLDENYFISTLTYMKLGEPSFGITPGELDFYLTLRSQNQQLLDQNKKVIRKEVSDTFSDFEVDISQCDEFPVTTSSERGVDALEKALMSSGFSSLELSEPLKWSEDFGYFTQKYEGAFFGLGIGESFPLHHPDYDFNDDLIEIGKDIYIEIIKTINGGL